MKIAVVGTGYVGLVTGTCFAEMGNDVICVDIDARKVQKMREGKLPIYEPGLEVFFNRSREEGRLTFTTELAGALDRSDIVSLALPTPPRADGAGDLSYVRGVAAEIGRLLGEGAVARRYKIVVNKSTVPVGTADRVRAALEGAGLRAGHGFDVVSNP